MTARNLPETEQRIVDLISSRIENARVRYGTWDVNDGRDYVKETLEEILDALAYVAAGLVKIAENTNEHHK